MVAATIDTPVIDTMPEVPLSGCKLSVEQVPLAIRQLVSILFDHLDADYEGIFVHLLRYARVQQPDDMAIISIPNQWQLHQQDRDWPCCYATLNTCIRLLCALGILHKEPRRKYREAEYHLPLTDYTIPLDAFSALDNLIDPEHTRNQKVRGLAEEVKGRLILLYIRQEESTVRFEQVDPVLRAALDNAQRQIEALGVSKQKKQQLITQISQVMMELYAAGKIAGSKISVPAVDSPPSTSSLEVVRAVKHVQERDIPDDGSTTTVDSDSDRKAKIVTRVVDSDIAVASHHSCSSTSLSKVVDFCTSEPTVQMAQAASQDEYRRQNLPGHSTITEKAVDFGGSPVRNLPPSHQMVDLDPGIDNDSNTFSKNLPQEKDTIVIEGAAAESTSRPPRALYRPIDARTARMLATYVEGNPGNFRSYITLSQKYHPQIIRAAIINMLAHTYFPDLEGDIPGDVDGELTGKIGRPRKPGAWVTSCCQAYNQYGIPLVMRTLLEIYKGPYSTIQKDMDTLSRELPPKQYWMQWQEYRLSLELGKPSSLQDSLPSYGAGGDTHAVHEGMTSNQAQELAKQMNREGRSYGITAKPCTQHGYWEVEMELCFQDCTSTYRFHSKQQWEQYFASIQDLSI